MAINKEKNVAVQVTFPKELAEKLNTVHKTFNENRVKVSKSDILIKAFENYLTMLIMAGSDKPKEQDKVEEPQGEKVNA